MGRLEVFTTFEGNEFIFEYLPAGSILNYRVLFTDDIMEFNVRFAQPTYLLQISLDSLEILEEDFPPFQKKVLGYQNNLLKGGQSYPLDYLVPARSSKQAKKHFRLNIFKNVTATIIGEVRDYNRKPKLGNILKKLKGQPKDVIRQKLTSLYSKSSHVVQEDPKFDKIMQGISRINKNVGIQLESL